MRLAGLFVVLAGAVGRVEAQVSMSSYRTTYTQNFDGLPASGEATWENGTYYFPGWTIQRSKAGSTIKASSGSDVAGGLYSYGNASNLTDRALGSISSLNAGEFAYGLLLQNNTGATIKALDLSYIGEQWRISNKTAGEHRISVWYAVSSSSSNFDLSPAAKTGWTEIPELTFFSPAFYTEGKTTDGNSATYRRLLTKILAVDIPAGYYIMLRFLDKDEVEADHGLAIDDLSVSWYMEATQGPTPLPVELVYFKAGSRGAAVDLSWRTASEDQNSHFVVERSSDGRAFEAIGMVAGNGTTSLATNYEFTDMVPLGGLSYYRLKQVDEDESYTYSNVAAVRRAEEPGVKVYPTITTSDLTIVSGAGIKQYFVLDVMGRKLLDQTLLQEQRFTVTVDKLNPGTYVLVLLDTQGKRHISRFVKR